MTDAILSTAIILHCQDKLFWVKRHEKMKFMGGFFSFVGGKVDAEDLATGKAFHSPHERPELHVCALRESFEETGYLALKHGIPPDLLEIWREKILQGHCLFRDLLTHFQLDLSDDFLTPAGTWVTPSFQPLRFQSHYFLCKVPKNTRLRINPHEHHQGEWIHPKEAIALWEKGRVSLPPPVLYSLRMFHKHQKESSLLEALQRPPQIYGKPGKRIEFRRGIQLLPLRTETLAPATHTNLYIVGDKDLYFIDPGSPFKKDRELLGNYIGHLIDDGYRPRKILLTHQHNDHVSAANWLRQRCHIPIAASKETAELLRPHFRVDEILNHGDLLTLDNDLCLEVLHTPGHAPGHLCFLERKTKTLFAGDMISGFGSVLIAPGDGGNMQDYMDSLEKLADNRNFDLILPAHGGSLSDAQNQFLRLIEHRRWRENQLLEKLEEAESFEELVKKTYSDVDKCYLPYAHLSALTIVEKLKNEQRWPKHLTFMI
jgi:glyoxylase-like metal-dependent hydrolase (beta-lactamase superfamily II)/8-oxo-dGTP pyrophosphatase MutT (NUDIX family)